MATPQDLHRVILHIDFDCYYCQVEMRRLGIPRETPVAVQQWEGLIAVNYPARDRGVTRHMRVKDAKKACPELVLVHVETLGADGAASSYSGEAAAGGGGGQGQATNRLTQKACLERYRRSTAEVLALLHKLAPAATCEKASIDEVYLDVTSLVDQELREREGAPAGPAAVDAFAWGSIVVGGPLDPSAETERRLGVGAGIACRLRGALLADFGYTSSAGIATNKLLAKVGSAKHKPNQQTLIPPRAAQLVMQDLPLDKLGGFGGKLGEALKALGCATAGQVQQLPRATLVARFGAERAAHIEDAVRGISHDPVQEKERPKSMLAAKSFNPTSDLAALERWFGVLAQELAGRMAADEAAFRRRARSLVLHYRGGAHPNSERSKACPMPRFAGGAPAGGTIAEAAFSLFRSKCAGEALPCSRLAIAAADFTDLPSAGSAITRFFQAGAAPTAASSAAGEQGRAGSGAGGGPQSSSPQRQQQQQQQQRRQGAGGPSITAMLERAQKRQRLQDEPEPAQQQQQQQQQQQHAEPPKPAEPQAGPAAASSSGQPPAQGVAGTPPAAVPAAAGDRAEAAAGEAGGEALAGVDVEEQRRMLRHYEMLSRIAQRSSTGGSSAGGGGGSSTGGARAGSAGGGKAARGGGGGGAKAAAAKQPGIAAFFKPPPAGG